MEIKKGISQMAEYPNAEINYVMPKDGRMYYVLKDGVLSNGCIIATLDPKYALDEKNSSISVGVFSESGEIIIDFDKKSIKSIANELVIVVNSKLNTPEVIGVDGKETDSMISQTMTENKEQIINTMMNEMGNSGEIIFSDPYSEANVYRIDSYNNKLGKDCSFIGKNETGLYFHTNEASSDTEVVDVKDFKQEEGTIEDESETEPENNFDLDIDNDVLSGFSIPTEDLQKVNNEENNLDSEEKDDDIVTSDEITKEMENFEATIPSDDSESNEVSLNIALEEKENNSDSEEVETNSDNSENIETDSVSEKNEINSDSEEEIDNEVLDNAIEVIDKMIKETNRLKEKISDLEKELEEKEKIIKESENKKGELNVILDKANEILEEIK